MPPALGKCVLEERPPCWQKKHAQAHTHSQLLLLQLPTLTLARGSPWGWLTWLSPGGISGCHCACFSQQWVELLCWYRRWRASGPEMGQQRPRLWQGVIFIFGCAGLHPFVGLPLVAVCGAAPHWAVRASHCRGLSCGAQAPARRLQ